MIPDLREIQSNALRGYRFDEALPFDDYVFVRFPDAATGRAWLARAIPLVTSCEAWDRWLEGRERAAVNLGFPHAGLRALAAPGDSIAEPAHAAYADGAVLRSEKIAALGDTGESAPSHWPPHFQRALAPHAVVVVSAATTAARAAALRELEDRSDGVAIVAVESGARLPGGKEHFGFADGIAQPDVDDGSARPHPGGGTWDEGAGAWQKVPLGEFVLGYPNALGSADVAAAWLRNGSFLVLRKLRQDVAGFERYVRELARRTGLSEDAVAARFVGRWKSGAPLVLAPGAEDPSLAHENDFRYAQDARGFACPIGAHIRRTNPRDEPSGPAPAQTAMRRILRRSIPYGSLADAERGMLFAGVVADIERQFEFVQANWVNSTLSSNALTCAADQDPIVGANDGTGKLAMPGEKGPQFAWDLPRFVTVRGSVYLFLPSLEALAALARGELAGLPWPFGSG